MPIQPNDILYVNQCSGCSGCINICPQKCISLKPNEKGFLSPVIDTANCIECDLCIAVCPINTMPKTRDYAARYFALQMQDAHEKKNSQSGGLSYLLSKSIIKKHGIVYGVAISDDFHVQYTRISDVQHLDQIRKSKYVQANPKNVFQQVEEDLLGKMPVLFTGTSCFTAGLLNYLHMKNIQTESLLTVDLVCHGVPSPRIFRDYLDYRQSIAENRIVDFEFRTPSLGWNDYREKLYFSDGTSITSEQYIKLFSSTLAFRESCYHCQFATFDKPSDITIGDYWGVDSVIPGWSDNSGISLAITHTQKGLLLLNDIIGECDGLELPSQDYCIQPNLIEPTKRPPLVDAFWANYNKNDFHYCSKKYAAEQALANGEYQVLERWVALLEEGSSIGQKLVLQGVQHIAICGEADNLSSLINDINKSGIEISLIIGYPRLTPDMSFSAYPCISIQDARLSLFSDIDKILIYDEIGMADILELFKGKNIPFDKILPLSFLTAQEE